MIIFKPMLSAVLVSVISAVICTSCQTGPDLTNINRQTPANSKPVRAELEIAGLYNVSGKGDNNGPGYNGTLEISNKGDAYVFNWHTSPARPTGIGVQLGNSVAVTYADPTIAKSCGVALYSVGPNSSLDGRIAHWGEYNFGTEKAEHISGSNFDGKYSVTGTRSDGEKYSGTIDVEKYTGGYLFNWHAGSELRGYGIWSGSRAAVTFGGVGCGFALYEIRSAHSLEGNWGSSKSQVFGTETAKRE